ncbi:MAG: hypothetical protein LKK11_04915 [Acidaminococcus sp.]|jgi:hypothetical protein|nr:hypothetical protein [Acidaminococcus sp.]
MVRNNEKRRNKIEKTGKAIKSGGASREKKAVTLWPPSAAKKKKQWVVDGG